MLQGTFLFRLAELVKPLSRPSVEIWFIEHPVLPGLREHYRFIRIEIQILLWDKVRIVRPQCSDIHTEWLIFAHILQPAFCTGYNITVTEGIFRHTVLAVLGKSNSGDFPFSAPLF